MTIYFLLLIIVFVSNFFDIDKNKKNKKIYIIFIFSLLTIVSICRSINVGVDTRQYYNNYYVISKLGWSQFLSTRYEFGFFFLCKGLSLISKDPQILIAFTSLMIIPTIGKFIYKYSSKVALSTFFYIVLNIYFFHLTGMRQSIAIMFLLYAFNFLMNDKKIFFIILTILASFFHSSAIIFILMVLIKDIKYNKNTYIIMLLITLFAFVASSKLFNVITNILGKYSGYSDSDEFGISNYFGAFFQFALTLFLYTISHIIYMRNVKNSDSKNNNFMIICMAIAMCTQAMSMKMTIIGRMNQYFWIYSIVAIPNILYMIKEPKKKILMTTSIMLVTIAYWLIIAIYRPQWNGAIPYTAFFELY